MSLRTGFYTPMNDCVTGETTARPLFLFSTIELLNGSSCEREIDCFFAQVHKQT